MPHFSMLKLERECPNLTARENLAVTQALRVLERRFGSEGKLPGLLRHWADRLENENEGEVSSHA